FAQQYNLIGTHLIDVSCTAIYNQTHAFITTPLNGCGTKYSETNQEIFFSNTLTSTTPVTPRAVITRTKSLKINFRCAYNRLVRKSGLDFQPPNPVLEITQSSVGNFTVELRSFANAEFLSSSSEQYPVFKSFQDRIYVQYRVITANSDIVVRAESCHATPTNKAYDTPQYQIIQDSCDKDSSINHLTFGLQQLIDLACRFSVFCSTIHLSTSIVT
ncbi:oncoprotein-induced transcript 3 protein-like, partial [Xenia sp. Carnegie-2017]|uniref:oncoprotein-induced transcript 3 protein-like n=1 Tax=Xenia sp. Carnegie-2017 TaxID=2897299 RepID=UPI001F047719